MKNKKVIAIIIIIIILILLIPVRLQLKDGGTKEYKSLTYKITKYHRLDENFKTGYITGWRIEIFGLKVYEKINADIADNDSNTDEKDINTNNNDNEEIVIKIISSLNQKISFEIENKTNNTYTYGTPYILERKVNDKWIKVIETDKCNFSKIVISLGANQTNPESVRLGYCYESLTKGQYRIVKTFYKTITDENNQENNTYYISGNFNID